ncbi:MAG: hypothetical protein B7Y39_02790 [Bdellovibrio sp. 28-41-41]|nr:MAG: hypothetical protein B7Y39_02790 [Bdellovibrio sp. 28-41-41]
MEIRIGQGKDLIRIKVVIALVVVSVLFISIIYNKFEQSLFADKVENVELQMKNQISTMVTAYEAEAKFLTKMAQNLNIEGSRRVNWASMSPYFALALLNDKNQMVEWLFREASPVSDLSKETLTQVVRSFQINPQSTQISYQFFQDQGKKRLLLTLVPLKDKMWVFVSLGENLQSLMDMQKTQSSALALVNKELVSMSHVKPEYVGQKIFENTVIKDLRENNKTLSTGSFSITSGEEFFAVMEKVPNMDLYLYTQTSLSNIIKSKEEFRRQFAFFSFGFLFILIGVSFLLVPIEAASPAAPKTVRGEITQNSFPNPIPPSSSEAQSARAPTEVSKDRVQNNMRIASALGHEMKAPLVKILSLVQIGNLAESKEETLKMINKVKSEVRSANEIVDKLLLFAGEKEQNKIKTKVDTPLLRAVKNLEGLCYQKVVKVSKEIGTTESFDMDVNQLVTVFENIIKNSIQAMDRKGSKEIKIKTYMENEKVVVLIEDNGEGIPKEISEKIFDPFFTSLNVGQHMGLGLTVALGIVRQHSGDVKVDSERGKGARVFIEFGLEATEQADIVSAPITIAPAAPTFVQEEHVKELVLHAEPLPLKVSAPNLHLPVDEADVVVIDDDEDDIVRAPDKLEHTPAPLPPRPIVTQHLNIPKVNEDLLLSMDEDKKPEGEAVAVNHAEDNEMFEELNLSSKPISIKPIDLNVDVDELFEVSNETPKTPQAPVSAAITVPPDIADIIHGKKEVQKEPRPIIVPPKLASHSKVALGSDNFKVTIRKPGRPM